MRSGREAVVHWRVDVCRDMTCVHEVATIIGRYVRGTTCAFVAVVTGVSGNWSMAEHLDLPFAVRFLRFEKLHLFFFARELSDL